MAKKLQDMTKEEIIEEYRQLLGDRLQVNEPPKQVIAQPVDNIKNQEEPLKVIPVIVKPPKRAGFFKRLLKRDTTNPMIQIVFTDAGDIQINTRIPDRDSSLNVAKDARYRIEPKEVWDISATDIKGLEGYRVIFHWQDLSDPLKIGREGIRGTTTENYSSIMKSNLVKQLLSPEMTFRDILTIVLIAVNVLIGIVILIKMFLLDKAT